MFGCFAHCHVCEHALFLVCNLATVRRTVHALLIHMLTFILHACVRVVGEEARIQVPQSVRQHLVRQASVMAPQGKAAYCGHEPWWLFLLGGTAHAHSQCTPAYTALHMYTCTHTYAHKSVQMRSESRTRHCTEMVSRVHVNAREVNILHPNLHKKKTNQKFARARSITPICISTACSLCPPFHTCTRAERRTMHCGWIFKSRMNFFRAPGASHSCTRLRSSSFLLPLIRRQTGRYGNPGRKHSFFISDELSFSIVIQYTETGICWGKHRGDVAPEQMTRSFKYGRNLPL